VALMPPPPRPARQVDRIVAEYRSPKGGRQYLVKWCGLEYVDATWETEAEVARDGAGKVRARGGRGLAAARCAWGRSGWLQLQLCVGCAPRACLRSGCAQHQNATCHHVLQLRSVCDNHAQAALARYKRWSRKPASRRPITRPRQELLDQRLLPEFKNGRRLRDYQVCECVCVCVGVGGWLGWVGGGEGAASRCTQQQCVPTSMTPSLGCCFNRRAAGAKPALDGQQLQGPGCARQVEAAQLHPGRRDGCASWRGGVPAALPVCKAVAPTTPAALCLVPGTLAPHSLTHACASLHAPRAAAHAHAGLGKTAQSISVIAWLQQCAGAINPCMVVAPLTTLGHWKREIQTWTDLVRRGAAAPAAQGPQTWACMCMGPHASEARTRVCGVEGACVAGVCAPRAERGAVCWQRRGPPHHPRERVLRCRRPQQGAGRRRAL
jgi:hypothetical protein